MEKNQTTEEQLEKFREVLIQTKYKYYQEYLKSLDDEHIGFEYADHIGNECRDFEAIVEHKGIGEVIARLEDWCVNALIDDPYYDPINEKYREACQNANNN